MRRLTRGALLGTTGIAAGSAALAWADRQRTASGRAVAAPAQHVTHLSFWGGWAGPDGAVMQRLVRRFNAQTPDVQVTLTLYNWDLIFDRWRTEFDGGSPPDIVGIHATEVAEYAASGMLREVLREAGRYGLHAADFFAPPWRLCQTDGGLYAIPLDIHPLALYINARAAAGANLDVSRPPRTGAELVRWAERLTDHTAQTWGYAAPTEDVECFRQWYSLLYQFGGRFMNDAQTQCTADSNAGITAFAFLRDLIARYQVAMPLEGAVDGDFLTGRVMMYLQGPWYIKGVQQAGLPFVTVPAPRVGSRPLVWANSHVLGIVNTLDASRVDAAMRFIAWISAHALDWAEAGQVPARNTARARLGITAIWPYLRPFAMQLPNIVYQPNLTMQSRLFAENVSTPVIAATQDVMLGRKAPAVAAHAMSEQVNQIVTAP
ncbi:MAG TPA: extracellular solute-binding protein [Chloroflexota bacterium]|nr:extracellular solute-binding protein [Chloroflexota bacterium]